MASNWMSKVLWLIYIRSWPLIAEAKAYGRLVVIASKSRLGSIEKLSILALDRLIVQRLVSFLPRKGDGVWTKCSSLRSPPSFKYAAVSPTTV